MQDIAQWGEVTLIVHTDDAIFEFTGAIPRRNRPRLFQPDAAKGLHGHLRHERCGAVAFVERPFMGKASAFIAFINVDGGIMFKVFVGRDETRALRGGPAGTVFRSLAEQIAPAIGKSGLTGRSCSPGERPCSQTYRPRIGRIHNVGGFDGVWRGGVSRGGARRHRAASAAAQSLAMEHVRQCRHRGAGGR